jgi:hypothetical protein
MPHPSWHSGPPLRAFAAPRRRRSIKILPGVRLNIGKRGISTSIGLRGAHVTFGKTGTRATVGLPGSGLSFTHLDKQRRERLVALAPHSIPARRLATPGVGGCGLP